MKHISVVLSLLIPTLLISQNPFGVKVNFGASMTPVEYHVSSTNYQFTHSHLPRFSGQFGLYYDYWISERIIVSSELLLSNISGREKYWTELYDGTSIIGESTVKIDRRMVNLSLPVHIGYCTGKFTYNFGAEFHYVMLSRAREEGSAIVNGQPSEWSDDYQWFYASRYDLGLRPGVVYNYSDRMQFEANAYFGLINLLPVLIGPDYTTMKVRQVTFGVRYNLRKPQGPVINK